ncbi:unnamed protein product [Gordionus sp. m RMFG-2023]|uniref:transmembrane protein 120B-like n=1 Tax=Gordionus sp. m RMFG-2023 TaxID=3053472 RepID=UPI0030DFD935
MLDGVEIQGYENCLNSWDKLDSEFTSLNNSYKEYLDKVRELHELEDKCAKLLKHHKYNDLKIAKSLTDLKDTSKQKEIKELQDKISSRNVTLRSIETTLPKQSSLYLKIILGDINVSLSTNEKKFKYKENYEKFKITVTMIIVILSIINLLLVKYYRVLDAIFCFLLVWYYCTLTIRESILRINGSRIKGWWISHHYISAFLCGVILTWPDGFIYQSFRRQFMSFALFISFLQILQYQYQKGCLYRLKALGERQNLMDITVEGFQSWMWKGLSFLLPFLFAGYFFQAYNSYTLYNLSKLPECHEWQVPVISFVFLVLFWGNFLTTSAVIYQKFMQKYRPKSSFQTRLLTKYKHY